MTALTDYLRQTNDHNPADFLTPKPGIFSRALSALTLPAPYVKALDVARYQEAHEVDYAKAYAAGYRLVIIKATEGTSYLDPMFDWHWRHALDAGFYVMLYHFFLSHLGGGAQADWFLTQTRLCREALHGRVAAWNDIERKAGAPAVTITARRSRALEWYQLVRASIPRVGAYSSPKLWQELMGNDSLSKYGDGWLAHWTSAKTPTLPPGWTDAATRIWQTGVYPTYPWVEPVPGVLGTVDVDRWLGDEKSLRDYLGYVDAPAPVDPLEARVKMLEDEYDAMQEFDDRTFALASNLDKRVTVLENAKPAGVSAPFRMLTRTPARCITSYNDAGKPILQIYPKDTSETSERIYLEGVVSVFPYPMIGDGGRKVYPVYQAAPVQLYVFADDGKMDL